MSFYKFRIRDAPASDILMLIKCSISTLWAFLQCLQSDNGDPAQEVIKYSLLLDTLVLVAGCKQDCLVVGACMPRFMETALPLTSPDLKPVIGGNSGGNSVGHLCSSVALDEDEDVSFLASPTHAVSGFIPTLPIILSFPSHSIPNSQYNTTRPHPEHANLLQPSN